MRVQFGDVIGISRRWYCHYAIYVDDNRVIHYTSSKSDVSATSGKVIETDIERFLRGILDFFVLDIKQEGAKLYFTRKHCQANTLKRARSRLDEKMYDLIFNNCEHFVLGCKTGLSLSSQVTMIF